MLNFKKIILASLLLPVTSFCSGVFSYDNLGYVTDLQKQSFVTLSSGYSQFYNPDGTDSNSQVPLAFSLGSGTNYKLNDRLYLGYEVSIAHLASQSFKIAEKEYSDHVFNFGATTVASFFFNPYLDLHLKAGVGYQLNSGSSLDMSGVNAIYGVGTGFYFNENSKVTFDLTQYTGNHDINSVQQFTTFTLGLNYYY